MLTLFDLRRESVGLGFIVNSVRPEEGDLGLGFSVNSVRPEEGECGVRFYC